jgi:hypothetical protein
MAQILATLLARHDAKKGRGAGGALASWASGAMGSGNNTATASGGAPQGGNSLPAISNGNSNMATASGGAPQLGNRLSAISNGNSNMATASGGAPQLGNRLSANPRMEAWQRLQQANAGGANGGGNPQDAQLFDLIWR